MTIYVRRINGGSFEIVNGHALLLAALEVSGKATVVDIETQEALDVHQVDGSLVILSSPQDAVAETLAASAIARAAHAVASDNCPICDGGGGWPGPSGWVACKPCGGSGKEPPTT